MTKQCAKEDEGKHYENQGGSGNEYKVNDLHWLTLN